MKPKKTTNICTHTSLSSEQKFFLLWQTYSNVHKRKLLGNFVIPSDFSNLQLNGKLKEPQNSCYNTKKVHERPKKKLPELILAHGNLFTLVLKSNSPSLLFREKRKRKKRFKLKNQKTLPLFHMFRFPFLQSKQKIKKAVATRSQEWQERVTNYTRMIQEFTHHSKYTASCAVRNYSQPNLSGEKRDELPLHKSPSPK